MMFLDECTKDVVPKGHCWHEEKVERGEDGSKSVTKRCCWCNHVMFTMSSRPHGPHLPKLTSLFQPDREITHPVSGTIDVESASER